MTYLDCNTADVTQAIKCSHYGKLCEVCDGTSTLTNKSTCGTLCTKDGVHINKMVRVTMTNLDTTPDPPCPHGHSDLYENLENKTNLKKRETKNEKFTQKKTRNILTNLERLHINPQPRFKICPRRSDQGYSSSA